jgi:ABC-type glycerol-3-phosphate transport system substrate-binding protein
MFNTGEPLQKVLNQATQDFMKENSDINVEVKWAGRNVLTQLQSAIAAGTPVDIVDQSDDRVYNAIVKNNLTLPLDKYMAEKAYKSDTAFKDMFPKGTIEAFNPSTVYMIPRDDYTSAFFYNKKMLSDLGISPPTTGMTWDQFVNMLSTIKSQKPDVSPLVTDSSISFLTDWWFTFLAIRVAGKDAFRAAAYDKTGEAWGDPKFLRAAQLLNSVIQKKYFQQGYQGSTWPSAQALWVHSKGAMIFMGAWLPAEMKPQTPSDFQIGMFAFPTVDGGQGNPWVEHWANVYAILKSTKYPDQTVRYLKYLMTPKVGQQVADIGTPVAITGVNEPPDLKPQNEIFSNSQQMPARAGLDTEIPQYMAKVFDGCDDKFFAGSTSPGGFISCLKAGTKDYWAANP